MKNIKKIIWICVIIMASYIIVILGRGIYWYYELEGSNVPIIISTQYSEVPTNIEVYIDGENVFKDDSLQTLYISQRIHLSCGIHKLRVMVDKEEFSEFFLVLPVRWIYIEVQKNDGTNYKDNKNWFSIDFSSTPTKLM